MENLKSARQQEISREEKNRKQRERRNKKAAKFHQHVWKTYGPGKSIKTENQ